MASATKMLVRHGLSSANDRRNFGKPAFAHPDASLMVRGCYDAMGVGEALKANGYDGDPSVSRVAVSTMLRTGQTALYAGFRPAAITEYAVLDEVDHDLDPFVLGRMIKAGVYPDAALIRADRLLDTLPDEDVYVTHGLLGSAALYLAGVGRDTDQPFIPRFASVRVLRYDSEKRLCLEEAIMEQRRLWHEHDKNDCE